MGTLPRVAEEWDGEQDEKGELILYGEPAPTEMSPVRDSTLTHGVVEHLRPNHLFQVSLRTVTVVPKCPTDGTIGGAGCSNRSTALVAHSSWMGGELELFSVPAQPSTPFAQNAVHTWQAKGGPVEQDSDLDLSYNLGREERMCEIETSWNNIIQPWIYAYLLKTKFKPESLKDLNSTDFPRAACERDTS